MVGKGLKVGETATAIGINDDKTGDCNKVHSGNVSVVTANIFTKRVLFQ